MLKRNTNVTFKLLLFVLAIILGVYISHLASNLEVQEQEPNTRILYRELICDPILFTEIDYACFYDIDTTEEYLAKVRQCLYEIETANKSDFTAKAACEMSKEISRLKEIEHKISIDLSKYKAWETEYYYATRVWMFFMQRGYNEAVTSAILGNMMIETSGGSLLLKPNIYSPSGNYYGLCQWSQKYYPGTKDLPFEHQLDYLLGSMPLEFNTFGNNYKQGFKYEDFINMSDVEEAALAFAKSYERCDPASYELRQQSAKIAYEYFKLY